MRSDFDFLHQDCEYGDLLGKVGLHCYNLQNRTNLEFFCTDEAYVAGILYATDPTREYSTFKFITREVQSKGGLSFITTQCTLLPEKKDFPICAVDDFCKSDMPNSLTESEVKEDKDWLRLYLELACRTKSRWFPRSPMWERPLELRKIIVQINQSRCGV
ncbi:PREDICTED: uncharacterized protein LOC104782904 isoform X1 [Camelina sativa]|uniref:Uncharacterized protein LOC104782904 isoform X1 n=1 Tax=Camelina sativa TaxID=90675 RepID=A0ABM1RNL9_CAMSA|nr:PREDICTED: uncharacterized protein LOC104782904 isoform X1 [Camelina sativa]XP_019100607.1 PREDICTED: uncharacterized protein LOC104782904 isoform X1 [Camelina sativa]